MDDDVRLTVGAILVALGILDPLVGVLLVSPRIRDEGKRRAVMLALLGAGVATLVLGILFLVGVFGGP